jgi:carbamoyl-phosphate synthase large subunit
MVGRSLAEQGIQEDLEPGHHAVKKVVFPFSRFEGVNAFLGPEMRSTGEVMGIAPTFAEAYSKAVRAAGEHLPAPGNGSAFVSVNRRDRERVLPLVTGILDLGFSVIATRGTQAFLADRGIPAEFVFKVGEGRPNVVDRMKNGDITFIINTPLGRESHYDERIIGETAYRLGIPIMTTLSAAEAAVGAIRRIGESPLKPVTLQESDPTRRASRTRKLH